MTSLEKALNEKYKFKPYSKNFKKMFLSEKKKILRALKKIRKKEVHHIGSTSVPGLGGKGIIDIIIVVEKKEVDKSKSLLKKANFSYDHTFQKKRAFFTKYTLDNNKKPRLVHLHLTFFGSNEKELALLFREHLKINKEDKKYYIKIKKIAAKKYPHNPKAYREYKNSCVEKILKNAKTNQKLSNK